MTRVEKDRILDGLLAWYEADEENVFYDDFLLNEKLGKEEWDKALESLTKEQFKKWDIIRQYYKTRLEKYGIMNKGSANFIREKLKQEGLWKGTIEDKLEEHELERCLDEVAKLIGKPVKKISDKEQDIIYQNNSDILGE